MVRTTPPSIWVESDTKILQTLSGRAIAVVLYLHTVKQIMQLDLNWLESSAPPSAALRTELSSPLAEAREAFPLLPAAVEAAVWRANRLGQAATAVVSSRWPSLDAELPGGGWPRRAVTEVLSTQPSVLEWRLLSRALRDVVQAGSQ